MNRLIFAWMLLPLCVGVCLAAEPAKPIHLGKVNTDKDEDDPHLASGGLQLYYASNGKEGRFTVWVATRPKGVKEWPEGEPLDAYLPDKPAENRSPFVTGDGKYPQYLFCASKDAKSKNFDIFGLVRDDKGQAFTTLRGINPLSTKEDETHPWLMPDGKELYFSRKTSDGWRVYVSKRDAAKGVQGWSDPKLVDLPAGFHHPTLPPDGRTMYLHGQLDKKRWGLFRSTWKDGAWTKPEELADLNDPKAPTGDRSPSLSRDGSVLYFASDRQGGKGGLDLWAIPVAELKK